MTCADMIFIDDINSVKDKCNDILEMCYRRTMCLVLWTSKYENTEKRKYGQ